MGNFYKSFNTQYQTYISLLRIIIKSHGNSVFAVFIMMILSNFLELVSIGSIIPFIAALLNPESHYLLFFKQFFHAADLNLSLIFTFIFIFLILFSFLIKFLYLRISTNLVVTISLDLSRIAYHNVLYQNFSTHQKFASSKIIDGLVNKISAIVFNILIPSLNVVSSLVMIIGISSLLLYSSAEAFIVIFGSCLTIYLITIFSVKNRIESNSAINSKMAPKLIETVHESISNIREVILYKLQPLYLEKYSSLDRSIRVSQSSTAFISSVPKILLETIAMLIFSIWLSSSLIDKNDAYISSLPTIALFLFATQKLLPLFQQLYSSTTTILGFLASLNECIKFINLETEDAPIKNISFHHSITLDKVCFSHHENKILLNSICLNILKGDRIGIAGKSGSGKSTLLDILMGFITPISGAVIVDGTPLGHELLSSLRQKISLVPQSIFLKDATIAENIAVNEPLAKINFEKVNDSIIQASLENDIKSFPLGVHTIIGEGGKRLSGGQRQRIAIARALYRMPEILILDEATSALDPTTESNIIDFVLSSLPKDTTVIIVSHRESVLDRCSKVYEIHNGMLDIRRTSNPSIY